MTAPPPDLKEFRIEFPGNGLAHIVFDAPGRTMNVFSEAAIVEIGLIARWLDPGNQQEFGDLARQSLQELRTASATLG